MIFCVVFISVACLESLTRTGLPVPGPSRCFKDPQKNNLLKNFFLSSKTEFSSESSIKIKSQKKAPELPDNFYKHKIQKQFVDPWHFGTDPDTDPGLDSDPAPDPAFSSVLTRCQQKILFFKSFFCL
jgi:hypothetical protein